MERKGSMVVITLATGCSVMPPIWILREMCFCSYIHIHRISCYPTGGCEYGSGAMSSEHIHDTGEFSYFGRGERTKMEILTTLGDTEEGSQSKHWQCTISVVDFENLLLL